MNRLEKIGILIVFVIIFVATSGNAAEKPINIINDSVTSVQRHTQFDFSSSPFTEVIPVDSATADELYFRAREWFSRAFKSSTNVLQMDSKERMTLVGRGTIEVPPGSTFGPTRDARGFVHFTISIYLKDGRYKYEIDDAKHETSWSRNIISAGSLYKSEADGSSIWSGKINDSAFKYIKEYSAEQIRSLIDSLKLAMSKSGSGTAKNDDW